MSVWVVTDGNGVVTGCANRGDPPAGAIVLETDLSVSQLAMMQIVNDVPVPRPTGPEIVSDGTTHTVTDCPEDTVIEVHDLIGGEIASTHTVTVDGDDVAVTLADAGSYRIEVTAPLPALPVYLEVIV